MTRTRRFTRRELLAFSGVAAVLSCVSPAEAAAQTLRGHVSYREKIGLPPHAILEVRLLDVSLADAPARTLAVTRVKTRHRMPIPYRLRFDTAAIHPGRHYALQARITVNGQLWFITAMLHSIFTGGPDKTDIVVERARSEAPEAAGPTGKWLAELIHGHGIIDNVQPAIEIAGDGRVTGSGGCNRLSGRAFIEGERITFGPMISTKMACPPAVMDQESRFVTALGDVQRFRVDAAKGKLILFNATSRPILVLARM